MSEQTTTNQTRVEQTPAEQMAERFAEATPGLKAAASAVGLQDHQRMLLRNDQRLTDGYQLGRHAFTGQKAEPMSEDGDMGDIVITGDINVSDPRQAPQVIDSLRAKDTTPSEPPPQSQAAQPPQPQAPPVTPEPQPPQESNWKKYGIPLALATLAAAGGAGGATYMLGGNDIPPQKEWGYEGDKYIPATSPSRVYDQNQRP